MSKATRISQVSEPKKYANTSEDESCNCKGKWTKTSANEIMHQRHRRSNSDTSSRYRERTCGAWWQPLTSSDFLLWHGRSIDLNTSLFWKPGYIHFSISILVGPHHLLGVFFCIFPCHHIPGLWYTNATPSPINLLFWSLTLLGKFHNVINVWVIQSWRSHIVIEDSSLVVLSATKRVLRRSNSQWDVLQWVWPWFTDPATIKLIGVPRGIQILAREGRYKFRCPNFFSSSSFGSLLSLRLIHDVESCIEQSVQQ